MSTDNDLRDEMIDVLKGIKIKQGTFGGSTKTPALASFDNSEVVADAILALLARWDAGEEVE